MNRLTATPAPAAGLTSPAWAASVFLPLVLLAAARAATAQEPLEEPRLETLFPRQAEVLLVSGGAAQGLWRLELPPEVLAECRGDLSDLRLLTADDEVISFAVDRGQPPELRAVLVERIEARIVEAAQSELPVSGAANRFVESYVVEVPERVRTEAGAWDLVLETSLPALVRQARVEALDEAQGAGDRGRLLHRGSVFRLPQSDAESLSLPLPALTTPRLGLRLEGQPSPPSGPRQGALHELVAPRIFFQSASLLLPRGRDFVPLRIASRTHADGRTQLELLRPAGVVPEVLRFDTTTPAFERAVTIADVAAGQAERSLASGRIYALPQVAGIALDARELPLAGARGERLRVTLDEGDNEPLRDLTVEAGARRTHLIFFHPAPLLEGQPAGAETAPLRILFGGARVRAPRFDLRALLARLPLSTRDASVLGVARLGTVSPNPSFDARPVLAFAHRAGAALDTAGFSHRRTVKALPSLEGLSLLRLLPADLAVLQPDLRDLRLIDADTRQWAYLLDADSRSQHIVARIEQLEPEAGDHRSRYRIDLEPGALPLQGVELETEVPFFDRAFELTHREERPGEPDRVQRLLAGRLRRSAGSTEPLDLQIGEIRAARLELLIEDGDDAPLVLSAARVSMPAPEVFFAAPAGDYELLLGNPGAEPPRYELERIRDVVLALQASATEVGPLEDHGRYRALSWARLRGAGSTLLLWGAVGLAVLVLTFLTLRLVRQDDSVSGE